MHDPDWSDNDLTWYEFSRACPSMTVIGSPDPPEPPLKFKTPEELTEITQTIKNISEAEVPGWDYTEYIYGTIIPHIEELHEADQLEWFEEIGVPTAKYNFAGYRNI